MLQSSVKAMRRGERPPEWMRQLHGGPPGAPPLNMPPRGPPPGAYMGGPPPHMGGGYGYGAPAAGERVGTWPTAAGSPLKPRLGPRCSRKAAALLGNVSRTHAYAPAARPRSWKRNTHPAGLAPMPAGGYGSPYGGPPMGAAQPGWGQQGGYGAAPGYGAPAGGYGGGYGAPPAAGPPAQYGAPPQQAAPPSYQQAPAAASPQPGYGQQPYQQPVGAYGQPPAQQGGYAPAPGTSPAAANYGSYYGQQQAPAGQPAAQPAAQQAQPAPGQVSALASIRVQACCLLACWPGLAGRSAVRQPVLSSCRACALHRDGRNSQPGLTGLRARLICRGLYCPGAATSSVPSKFLCSPAPLGCRITLPITPSSSRRARPSSRPMAATPRRPRPPRPPAATAPPPRSP